MGHGAQTEEAQESIDAEDKDYEEDAAIEDVVEEEPVEFADPEDDEFELEEFLWRMCNIFPLCISLHYNY